MRVKEFIMPRNRDKITQASLITGIVAMTLLVIGTVAESSSLLQKILFVIGAPVLGIVAYANRQKMFAVLQAVATIGAALAFFPDNGLKYAVMIIVAAAGIGYLLKVKYYSKDRLGIIGTIGLAFIAIGFATNPIQYPKIFGFLLGFGGILIAFYSAIEFFRYKIRISAIWLVLNIIFSINPILMFLSIPSISP